MKFNLSLLAIIMAACLGALSAPVAANSSTAGSQSTAASTRATGRCVSCQVRPCASDNAQRPADARPAAQGDARALRHGRCDAILDTGYFPAEQDHIAAYLAKQHYPFE